MNCIILGDKYQNGMKSRGCPALINIANKVNTITHQYSVLKSLNHDINIIYVYGFDEKKFLDFYNKTKIPIHIVYNEKYGICNQAFSLSLVKEFLEKEDTLIIDGYQKLNKTVIKKILQNTTSSILVYKNIKRDEEAVGCIIEKDMVVSFSFDLDNIVPSVYYLDKNSSLNLCKLLNDTKNHNNFIFELLNKIIDQGNSIKPVII